MGVLIAVRMRVGVGLVVSRCVAHICTLLLGLLKHRGVRQLGLAGHSSWVWVLAVGAHIDLLFVLVERWRPASLRFDERVDASPLRVFEECLGGRRL